MTNHELAEKLRCSSTVHDAKPDCDACPFWETEELPEDMKGHYPEGFLCQCDVDRIALMAAAALENQESHIAALRWEIEQLRKRAPQWVSVAERLPDNNYDVLVLVSGVHGKIVFDHALMFGAWFGDGGWFVDKCPLWSSPGVTHWMPLPEPPGGWSE